MVTRLQLNMLVFALIQSLFCLVESCSMASYVSRKALKAAVLLRGQKEVVQRHLAGETKNNLVREFGLSPDQVVRDRPRKWRKGGDEALKPKPKGRPKGAANPKMLTEGDKLPREYDQLRTDNAYLKKLRYLRNQGHS